MSDQHDLFPEPPRDESRVDPDDVRSELLELLTIAREARDEAPWDRLTHEFHAVVFPQMARWLPEEEAQPLCLAFAQELERIQPLLAAKSRGKAVPPTVLLTLFAL